MHYNSLPMPHLMLNRPGRVVAFLVVLFAALAACDGSDGAGDAAYEEALRLQEEGEWGAAAEAFDRAIELDPEYPRSYNNRANL